MYNLLPKVKQIKRLFLPKVKHLKRGFLPKVKEIGGEKRSPGGVENSPGLFQKSPGEISKSPGIFSNSPALFSSVVRLCFSRGGEKKKSGGTFFAMCRPMVRLCGFLFTKRALRCAACRRGSSALRKRRRGGRRCSPWLGLK